MTRSIVGGRSFEEEYESVSRKMKGVGPEPIREHVVEIGGVPYPPKQVLARLTGWERTSFTTMEAQRVLTRLGFTCRRANARVSEIPPSETASGDRTLEERLAVVENEVAVMSEALASLRRRIAELEDGRG